MLLQDRPRDELDLRLALAQEMFGGGSNRNVVPLTFPSDKPFTSTVQPPVVSALILGISTAKISSDKNIRPLHHGKNKCASTFDVAEDDVPTIRQSSSPARNNQDLLWTEIGAAAGSDCRDQIRRELRQLLP